MAPSSPADLSTLQIAENDLLPYFVLHKGSSTKSKRKSASKTRRRIDLSPSSPKISKADTTEGYLDDDDDSQNLRLEALNLVWSKIESTIKDVLRDINADAFNDIDRWVHDSFDVIRSSGIPHLPKATASYPIVTDATSNQLFTGLVFTKNIDFVDDLKTFTDLSLHLNSHGCHVANLSSSDFSSKNAIGGCLRSLMRQFLMVTLDTPDISILASWYSEQGNYASPVVVIISDMERCCGSVLADFILMLSEWVVKIPVILIMGVATTVDAPRNILPSNVLQYLSPCKFNLGSPAERMDAIIEAVLVKQSCSFSVGHKVATFLRNYFIRQDGTLTSFIRALKIAIVQHFFMEPSSLRLGDLFIEEGSQALIGDPRRRIQIDLVDSSKILKCSCCNRSGNIPLSSMPDASIMYILSQEHRDLINLHDWYQSFKAIVQLRNIKVKHRLKHSLSPKKRMDIDQPQNKSEASVQARFCRAVTELQITGLLRMPSKRRPDYLQRVAFGL